MAEFNINNGVVFTPKTVTQPLPIPDGAFLQLKDRGGRLMYGQVGPSGVDYSFQSGLFANKIGYYSANGLTVATTTFGMGPMVVIGTGTAVALSTTNLFGRTRRIKILSASTAGSLAGQRLTSLILTMGSGAILTGGGFYYVVRFGISDAAAVAGARMFVGLRTSASSPTNVEPSTLTNVIGVGHGAADTTLRIYYGGSAAQTPINLGALFPSNTRNTDLYELALFNSPSSTDSVGYRVERLNTGDVAMGTLTGTAGVALPLNTALLSNNDYRTNNATALAVALDYVSIYYETDY